MKAPSPSAGSGLGEQLERTAHEAGFLLAGALDIDLALSAYQTHVHAFQRWLGAGYAAGMGYLARGAERREDLRRVFPSVESVLVVALPYSAAALGSPHGHSGPRLARYLRGRDYHVEIPERLERALNAAKSRFAPDLAWKICTDTSAVLERAWAYLAGLGWIGKNSMLIHPQWGSYFLLGEALLNVRTGQGPRPLPDYCGSCDRCLKACPTQAIVEAKTVDSRRCISAQTLEERGPRIEGSPQALTVAQRSGWIAGCDVCQEVCPFNTKAAKRIQGDEGQPFPQTWAEWQNLGPERYAELVKDSALDRIRYADLQRNLAEALGSNRK